MTGVFIGEKQADERQTQRSSSEDEATAKAGLEPPEVGQGGKNLPLVSGESKALPPEPSGPQSRETFLLS